MPSITNHPLRHNTPRKLIFLYRSMTFPFKRSDGCASAHYVSLTDFDDNQCHHQHQRQRKSSSKIYNVEPSRTDSDSIRFSLIYTWQHQDQRHINTVWVGRPTSSPISTKKSSMLCYSQVMSPATTAQMRWYYHQQASSTILVLCNKWRYYFRHFLCCSTLWTLPKIIRISPSSIILPAKIVQQKCLQATSAISLSHFLNYLEGFTPQCWWLSKKFSPVFDIINATASLAKCAGAKKLGPFAIFIITILKYLPRHSAKTLAVIYSSWVLVIVRWRGVDHKLEAGGMRFGIFKLVRYWLVKGFLKLVMACRTLI